ncbi:sodium:calcium antiporter [Halospeciosus flavus]|uniref:Sodium:calcium antiporter n=1 Tax=Halospeciosus flavus TaxID=3032283 RepID=A0ABD5Z1Z0_9EURY
MFRLLSLLALAVGATGVVWVGASHLEDAADRLATYYGLPAVVQGAVVAAVGSSFPELSSTTLAVVLHGEFELGVAAIVGSAVFNVLVIPAASTLAAPGSLGANRDLVYKEAQFYMLAVATLLVTFAFAAIYNPVLDTPGVIRGHLTRALALIPIALYGLYVFIQAQDTRDQRTAVDTTGVSATKQWAILVGSLALILVGVEGLVRAALALGTYFGTSPFLWGLTVIAAGTSLPDALVSVRAARGENGDGGGPEGDAVSLANVFGSNVFDLLVAVPAGVLLAGTTVVNFSRAVPMFAFLVGATVIVFTAMRTELALSRHEAGLLLAIYVGFVVWMVAESTGATNVVLTG